jgi:hypothetical protein
MIAVPARTLLAMLLLAISLYACNRKDPSPFQYEAQWLRAVWAGDAELKQRLSVVPGPPPRRRRSEIPFYGSYRLKIGGGPASVPGSPFGIASAVVERAEVPEQRNNAVECPYHRVPP